MNRLLLVSTSIVVVFLSLLWAAARPELLGNLGLPFGYYGDFNTVKRLIERAGCVEAIKHSRHENLILKSFHFRARSSSGWIVRLWFFHGMDVEQVCSRPKGLFVMHPTNWQKLSQGYSIEDLSEWTKEKNLRVTNLKDVLCNLSELAPMFKLNYDNPSIPRVTPRDAEYLEYLHVEIVDEDSEDDFDYSNSALMDQFNASGMRLQGDC